MTAPIASGWSGCRVGLTPTGKRRLSTAHAISGHYPEFTEGDREAPTETAKPRETLPLPVPVAPAETEAAPDGTGALAPVDRAATGGARPDDIAGAFAQNTRDAYLGDWRQWSAFAAAAGKAAMPADPETVRDFLAAEAARGRKLAVLRRRLTAIATLHRLRGAPFERNAPVIAFVMRRLARELGTATAGRAELMSADIQAMLRVAPATLQGLRDRAILLLGFASGLRRSELVALDVVDLEWRRDGLLLHIRRSKGDQEGAGQVVGVLYGRRERSCPVRALKRYLEAAAISDGPVFRPVRGARVYPRRLTDEVVYLAVKRYGAAAGLDPSRLGGHSLRVGHATQALAAGADPVKVKAQLRHRRLDTTLSYNRTRPFEGNSSGKLDL